MTAPTGPRRGPRRLDGAGLAGFLSVARQGALCTEDESGDLVAIPVGLVPGGATEVRLISADPAVTAAGAERGAPVCVVADEFESYEGIQGVIVQGSLHPDPAGGCAVQVTRVRGFTFAGTSAPQVPGPGGTGAP